MGSPSVTERELEHRVAKELDEEAGCVMPSGTTGNPAAILAHCPCRSMVIVGSCIVNAVLETGVEAADGRPVEGVTT